IVRFSLRSSNNAGSDVNPLILLHGPPGTGKTSLCQGLAQKIAIRLRSQYDNTIMIQINTSTLLSKYYSESAKQVDEIFTKIARMCQEESHTFTCVLIDEVESIASSREYSTNGGESHDSLRATNALLTGLDKTKNYPNLIFLCTSNMIDALDNAFLDRCGLKREVTAPPLASQYEILRIRLQKL
ncbi:AAA ATPase, partial [Acephala macrosclerotiorum]